MRTHKVARRIAILPSALRGIVNITIATTVSCVVTFFLGPVDRRTPAALKEVWAGIGVAYVVVLLHLYLTW